MKKKPASFNITSKWVKFMAVGCSHGRHIDPLAREKVLALRERWNPALTLHMGDAIDMTAFMGSGRSVGKDSAEPIAPDIDGGVEFLRELRPNVFLLGNHEVRAWRLREDSNAVIAYAAQKAVGEIEDACRNMKARIVEYSGVFQTYKRSNITFTHGTIYNENAGRDYAEMYGGTVVHAHTHKACHQFGRTLAYSSAYCVGTLTRRADLAYANTRRATLAWSHGVVAGEFREGANPASAVWLFSAGQGEEWRLPL